jgi:hypothetical protein
MFTLWTTTETGPTDRARPCGEAVTGPIGADDP